MIVKNLKTGNTKQGKREEDEIIEDFKQIDMNEDLYQELLTSFEAIYEKEEKQEQEISDQIFLEEHKDLISDNNYSLENFKKLNR